MTLWIVFIVLSCAALAFIIWPFYKKAGRLTPLLAILIVVTVVLSAVLYQQIGRPGVPSGAGPSMDSSEVVDALAARLEDNPDDIEGWRMLGRSYQAMQRYDEAVDAFEKAIKLEKGQNGQTLVALAITLMERESGGLSERADSLFESALALDPANPNALFYGGGAAARRGDTDLAADRWETLLNQDAPPEIRDLLQRKINEWRGIENEPAAQLEASLGPGAIVSVNISLSADAAAALTNDSTVFVIARDPAQPSPPIAVVPRRVSDLPTTVDLGDQNAMIKGRPLSGFASFEVVARVSLSGSPGAQPGDWFGSVNVEAGVSETLDLSIDQVVP